MSTTGFLRLGERREGVFGARFDIFDGGTDPALDELTETAAMLCGAEYAYLGWLDADPLWF